MAKQSNLEKEGIEKRNELSAISDYQKVTNEYSESHPDAKSDGDPQGKGTGIPMGYSVPGESTSKGISYKNMDTAKGGGLYDAEGRNRVGGRVYLQGINMHSQGNSYVPDSVDTSNNVAEGQYLVK